jgi:hypothetical protein
MSVITDRVRTSINFTRKIFLLACLVKLEIEHETTKWWEKGRKESFQIFTPRKLWKRKDVCFKNAEFSKHYIRL